VRHIDLAKLPFYLAPEIVWNDQNDDLGCRNGFLNYLLKPRIRVHVEDLRLLCYLLSVYLLNLGSEDLEHSLSDGYLIRLYKDSPSVNGCQPEKGVLLNLSCFFQIKFESALLGPLMEKQPARIQNTYLGVGFRVQVYVKLLQEFVGVRDALLVGPLKNLMQLFIHKSALEIVLGHKLKLLNLGYLGWVSRSDQVPRVFSFELGPLNKFGNDMLDVFVWIFTLLQSPNQSF